MSESRDEKFQRQTKENFEHLGRFVQEFEQVIFTIRLGIRDILASNSRAREELLDVVLNHQALTAKPLWDILRGIIAEATNAPPFSSEERKVINEILKQTATEFQALTELRNTIIHGTWFIGWASSTDEDFTAMTSVKWKITAEGVKPVDDAPKNVEELKALVSRCNEAKRTITALLFSVRFSQSIGGVTKNFSRAGKQWVANSTWRVI